MSLSDAIATQAPWIQIWVGWIAAINISTLVLLLIKSTTRKAGLVVGAAFIVNYLLMNWLYGQVGYVRLLGLAHVVVWTPLALYLVIALRGDAIKGWMRRLTQAFLITICVSLVFDVTDVARWVMGERASMLPSELSDG